MLDVVDLPDDIAALKAMLIASQLREVRKDDRIERLEKLVAAFKQAAFGRKSEKSDPEQFDLALEDLETAMAAVHAEDEADSATPQPKPRAANRGSLPSHLPRVDAPKPSGLSRAYGIPSARSSRCSNHKSAPTTSNRADMIPSKADAL